MSNHLKRCHCKECRRGLRTAAMSQIVQKKIRSHRHKVKAALKKGVEPPRVLFLDYTD